MPFFFRSITWIFVVAVIVAAIPLRARGEDFGLIVTGQMRLALEHSPYRFDYITVQEGGLLSIDAGVTLTIAGGSILVFGGLSLNGTLSDPIVISGFDGGMWQDFMLAEHASQAFVSHVRFRDFVGPLTLLNGQKDLGNIELLDGIHNTLVIGQPGQYYGDVTFSHVTFTNRRRGKAMRESRIVFLARMGEIIIDQARFEAGGPFASMPWDWFGIIVSNGYAGLELTGVRFPYDCGGEYSMFNAYSKVVFSADVHQCAEPDLPTIFVPGYGSSLNLKALTQWPQDVIPNQAGWRFLRLLTPSYFDLARDFRQSGVGYETAYYDWRLNAAESASVYLKPLIEETKRKYGVSKVNLATHSFGGTVARSYIYGDHYEGDVADIVQFGTPNQGAAKAYAAWEGAELPEDWSPLYHLLRFYRYKYRLSAESEAVTLRSFFPSGRELMPIYPALYRNEIPIDMQSLRYANTTLYGLREAAQNRPSLTAIQAFGSNSLPTLTRIDLGEPNLGWTEWPDGEVAGVQVDPYSMGDGTVPLAGLRLEGMPITLLGGNHAALPGLASRMAFNSVYPRKTWQGGDPFHLSTWMGRTHTFAFDCPVEVTIRLPDGSERSSAFEDDTERGEIGSIIRSDELILMVLPRQEGEYKVTVKATADTLVRSWVDKGPIAEFDLVKDEISVSSYISVSPKDEAESLHGFHEALRESKVSEILPEPPSSGPPSEHNDEPGIKPVASLSKPVDIFVPVEKLIRWVSQANLQKEELFYERAKWHEAGVIILIMAFIWFIHKRRR